jgi:hypothetical protein
VDRQIRIDGGTADDYGALADYLNASRDFRGRVRLVTGPPEDGKLDADVIQDAYRHDRFRWARRRPFDVPE